MLFKYKSSFIALILFSSILCSSLSANGVERNIIYNLENYDKDKKTLLFSMNIPENIKKKRTIFKS